MVKKTTVNASGVKADRPALNEILEFIRKGDCLVVWRLDRLGRSLKHLIEVVEDLENRKVGFVSLQEGINTTTAGGRLVFHLFGALSEFEHNLIRERTCAGATAAGIVLLAKDPSAVFPQCRILADAYRGAEPDGAPRDHEDIRGAMPQAIERAIAFIDRNTRHPMRIVGLNRVRLDEYPVDGLREALVNAAAHRQYEDAGRKILLEVFSDRIVLSSPGLPPKPLTLASLRKGKYRPCSRNPVLAQCLSYFHRIEERGSGFRRMHDQMLNHGLDQPLLSTEMGYFQVTFPGPGENIERLRAPERQLLVTPAVEALLNDRQRRILSFALENGSVTTGWCMETLGVVRDTAHRDLTALVKLGLLTRLGSGRNTRYVRKQEEGIA